MTVGVKMARVLSQRRWAVLWVAQGGDPSKADLFSAVIMAESGGDASSVSNPCCKGGAQINLEAHPDVSLRQALNPAFATRWTIKNSNNGTNFSIWEAYTNGSYRAYLGKSGVGNGRKLVDLKTPLFDVPLPGPDLDFTNPLGPLSPLDPRDLGLPGELQKGGPDIPMPYGTGTLPELISSVTQIGAFFRGFGELVLTPEGWLRLAKLLGGIFLLIKGLSLIIRESTGVDVAKSAKKTATKAAEAAAVIATVK